MVLQAVLFDRFKWSTEDAKQWLKEHSFLPIKKVHITDKFKRFRIAEPDYKKYKYKIILTKPDNVIASDIYSKIKYITSYDRLVLILNTEKYIYNHMNLFNNFQECYKVNLCIL